MADTNLFMNLIKHRLCHVSSGNHSQTKLAPDTAEHLMALAQKHDLTAIIGSELLEEDMISSEALKLRIQEEVCQAACYFEIMNHELQWLKDILENAQIPHVVLKGGAVRNYYPDPWLRTSGDIDILIQEETLDKAVSLLLEKGCNITKDRRYHDIPMKTPRQNLLELHFSIREDIPVLDKTLDRVWDYCEKVPGKEYEYRQSKEFLLFHMLSHMSYHLIHGGCGIRSFVDIWLLQQAKNNNIGALHHLCSEAQLTEFYKNVQLLNDVWFGAGEHTPVTKLLEQLVITGGTFGTKRNQILIEQAYSGNKSNYLLKRIFMPYSLLKKQYPLLEKRRFLVPVFQVARWIRIITGCRTNLAFRELHTGQTNSSEKIKETKLMLQSIGLNFHAH